jgi:hypothetical protein
VEEGVRVGDDVLLGVLEDVRVVVVVVEGVCEGVFVLVEECV